MQSHVNAVPVIQASKKKQKRGGRGRSSREGLEVVNLEHRVGHREELVGVHEPRVVDDDLAIEVGDRPARGRVERV